MFLKNQQHHNMGSV